MQLTQVDVAGVCCLLGERENCGESKRRFNRISLSSAGRIKALSGPRMAPGLQVAHACSQLRGVLVPEELFFILQAFSFFPSGAEKLFKFLPSRFILL